MTDVRLDLKPAVGDGATGNENLARGEHYKWNAQRKPKKLKRDGWQAGTLLQQAGTLLQCIWHVVLNNSSSNVVLIILM